MSSNHNGQSSSEGPRFHFFYLHKMNSTWTLDKDTMWGIGGQLAGHGLVWAKQIAGGAPLSRVLSQESLFWAVFSILSETLTTPSANLAGTSVAGIAGPAAVQSLVLSQYASKSKQTFPRLLKGEVSVLLDDASLAGTLGSVLAKSYA